MEGRLINPLDYLVTANPSDDQYEYIGGRLKKKRELKKQYKAEGMSGKDARKAAKSTLKSGIKAITTSTATSPIAASQITDNSGEGGEAAYDELGNPLMLETGGETDYTNYLIYGGIGVVVLAIVGVLAFSGGGETAAPVAA